MNEDTARRLVADLAIDADGVGRWTTNNSVIPDDAAEAFGELYPESGLDVAATKAARVIDTREALARYRERRARVGYSAEELYEMRAAFGPGTEVVDVITGKTIKL